MVCKISHSRYDGEAFRICHWPFFQVLIRIASILGLISAIWAMCVRKKLAGDSNGKVVMAAISVIASLVGFWFFISHWPGATIILIVALGVLVPVPPSGGLAPKTVRTLNNVVL